MTRALCLVVALAACPRPTTSKVYYDPNDPQAGEPGAGSASAADPATADAAGSATSATSASATPDVATPPTPASPPVRPGTAAYCLYVGAEQRVVRCYWQRGLCDEQITFNKETEFDKSQECRGVAEVFCFVGDKSERCYPTAAECGKTVASMRQRNRQATDCVTKTRP